MRLWPRDVLVPYQLLKDIITVKAWDMGEPHHPHGTKSMREK